jgi:16S rRNA processing protein RimM
MFLMMEKENCFYLGQITRIIGFKGEVAVYIDSDEPEKYAGLDAVFVDLHGNFVPFFVENLNNRNKSNQFNIKFQDVENAEDASRLVGCELYLPLDALPPLEGDAFYYHEIEGYEVHDEQKGFIGTIIQVVDYPGNPLFEINFNDKTILVPVRDEFISSLDRPNRRINISAPEGLIDLYLE